MSYLEDFLTYCEFVRGLAQNTVRNYEADLKKYLQWIGERGVDVIGIKAMEIDQFFIHLRKDHGNSISTANRALYALKAFYKWLLRIEAINRNPLDLFQNVKEPKRLPKYLTPEQQEALILASRNGSHKNGRWISKRDHLLILLLLDLGLRISEACDIKVQNINLNDGTLKVVGKGNKERESILSNRVKEAISDYIALIEKKRKVPIDFLFSTSLGERLGTRHVYRMVKDIGKRAGIDHLHPHTLRHSFATNLRRRNGDLMLIKEALGHSSVSTTQIYCGFSDGEFKEKMRALIN